MLLTRAYGNHRIETLNEGVNFVQEKFEKNVSKSPIKKKIYLGRIKSHKKLKNPTLAKRI